MRRNLCNPLLRLALAAVVAGATPGLAWAQAGSSGAAFLLMPIGGRAAGLGQAAVSDGGTNEAVFWNPAGLARIEGSEVAVNYAQTFVSNNTALTAIMGSTPIGVFGITAYLVDFGSQEVVTGEGPVTGRISPKNLEFAASFATRLFPRLDFGLNYKVIQFRQDCSGDCGLFPSVTGTTMAVDAGVRLHVLGEHSPLIVGAALLNAGFNLQLENSGQADPLPTRLRMGLSYGFELARPTPESQPLDARFLFDIDNAWDDFGNPDLHVGIEVGYGQLIRLRTGYASINKLFLADDASDARGPAVGVGLGLGRISLDFSRIFFDTSNFDEPVYITLRADL
jgi:hypothetical protein